MKKRVNEVKRWLSHKYGGFTAVKGQGGYAMQEGNQLVQEPVVKVTSFTKRRDFSKNKLKLIQQLQKWRGKWHQESMGIEIEGDLEYVEASDKPRHVVARRPFNLIRTKQNHHQQKAMEMVRKVIGF
jgi:hypothetical protein